jgi:hypothetical protein
VQSPDLIPPVAGTFRSRLNIAWRRSGELLELFPCEPFVLDIYLNLVLKFEVFFGRGL